MNVDDRELSGGDGPPGHSRRRFLARTGLAGAAAVTATALPGVLDAAPSAWAQNQPTGPSKFPSPDEKAAGAIQVLERTVAAAYQALLPLVTDPAVNLMLATFQSHHTDHVNAIGKLLNQGDTDTAKVVAEPNRLAAFQAQISAAGTNQTQLIQVALNAEVSMGATYLGALGKFQVASNAGSMATILPVEEQHAAALSQALGQPIDQILPDVTPLAGAVDLSGFFAQQ